MLLQTNSYVVPKERRAEHQRLLRRFRQTLARLGCEHFEVYEQVGPNWSASDNGGRYVQIMRFRDRRHQLAVQSAERADPGAQAVIAEFCNLINFPYQQQQGLFAVGFYQSALPVTMRREATRAEVEASDGAAVKAEAEASVEESGKPEPSEDEDLADSAADEAEQADSDDEVELKAEAETDFEDEDAAEEATGEDTTAEEDDELEAAGASEEGVVEEAEDVVAAETADEAEVAASIDETEQALSLGADDAESAEPDEKGSAGRGPEPEAIVANERPIAGVGTTDDDEPDVASSGSPDDAEAVEEKLFGGEETEAAADPAFAVHAERGFGEHEVSIAAEAGREVDELETEDINNHEPVAQAGAAVDATDWAGGPEQALESSNPVVEVEPQGELAVEAIELSAEEGDIEIVYEQLPATAEEAKAEEAVAQDAEADEESGFDALLSNEQLLEDLDAHDDLDYGAAHTAELHAHSALGGRNGNSVPEARHGRIR